MTPSAPTKAQALMALAERIESEEPSGSLWESALVAIHGERSAQRYRFHDFVHCQAWRDAAAMLMPEGWTIEELFAIEGGKTFVCRLYLDHRHDLIEGEASGPHAEARTRLAAALRARAAASEGV